MTPLYRLVASRQPKPADPLHASNIYKDKQRVHRGTMKDRQDLILYLAKLHTYAQSRNLPRGLREVKLRLTSLREWVYDFHPALDYFFEIKQLGYSISDTDNDITVLIPRDINVAIAKQVEELDLRYSPPPRPDDGIVSKVYLQLENRANIKNRLQNEKRHDLIDPVLWLFSQPSTEHNFIFTRSGKLQQRDKSVWPIAGIETWPSWLREALFGPGIDIDSAYTQYLMQHLKDAHSTSPHQLGLMYHDLVRLLDDKEGWRRELCAFLGLEWNDANRALIKTVCMSLANGSSISPSILAGGNGFSITADIIVRSVKDATPENLERIGVRLQSISRQYGHAKKTVCAHLLRLNPSRKNQKLVFNSYFEWERVARYLIWEECDRHGLMMHDGIDGVPERYTRDLPTLIEKIGIKVTI
jgi:hypothetical protein